MATCKNCNKSGLFLKLSPQGLCADCFPKILKDIKKRLKVIEDLILQINNTKDVKRNLPRYEKLLAHLHYLIVLEDKGMKFTKVSQKSSVEEVLGERDFAINNWMKAEADNAIFVSENANSTASKIRPLVKFITLLRQIKQHSTNPEQLNKLEVLVNTKIESLKEG